MPRRTEAPKRSMVMWKAPGAIQASPDSRKWPGSPSRMVIFDFSFCRSERSRVKRGGICWTITMGTGKLLGKAGSILARAFGPPVEAPIARMSIREGACRWETGVMNCYGGSDSGTGSREDWGSLGRSAQIALILGISSERTRSAGSPGTRVRRSWPN